MITYRQEKKIKIGKLLIPGGWDVQIPEVGMLDSEDESLYVQYWARKGLTTKEAIEKIRQDTQQMYNIRYMMLLRSFLGECFRKYSQKFPHLGVEGFDHKLMARYFVPGRGPLTAFDHLTDRAIVNMGKEAEND